MNSPASFLSRPVAALAVGAASIQLVAIFANKGIAVLFILTALGGLITVLRRGAGPTDLLRAPFLLVAALLAWSLLSALWSLDPTHSLTLAGVLFGMVLGGVALTLIARHLSGNDLHVFQKSLVVGYVVALAFFIEERLTGDFLVRLYKTGVLTSNLNHSATLLAMGLCPVLMALRSWDQIRIARMVAGVAVIGILSADNLSAVVGLAAGLAVIPLVKARPASAIKAIAGLVVIGFLAAPLIPRTFPAPGPLFERDTTLTLTFAPRVFIWQNVADRIAERPLIGWGLNSSPLFSNERQKVVFGAHDIEPIPLHPHNGVLQFWLELGAVGALLAAAVVVSLLMAIRRLADDPWQAALATATLVTALAITALNYSLWQGWWMGSYWLMGVFVTALLKPASPAP